MAIEYKLSYPAAEINEKLGKIVDLDTTLTHEGEAADAKATGDALNQIKDDLDELVLDYNLLNKSEEYKEDYYANAVDPIGNSSYSCYTYIPVTKGTAYKTNFTARFVFFMGQNKTSSGQATLANVTSFTPNYDGFVHITIEKSNSNYRNTKLCLDGINFDDVARYPLKYISKSVMAQTITRDGVYGAVGSDFTGISNMFQFVNSFKLDSNIYNNGTLTDVTETFSVIDGEFIRYNGTGVASSAGYQRTDYIDIANLDGVNVFANYSSGIATMSVYDVNYKIVGDTVKELLSRTFTSFDIAREYPNAKYVRFSCYYATNQTKKLAFKKNLGTTTLSEKIDEIASGEDTNPLKGKKLCVDGDSICYGAGYVGGYAKIIGENNNMTVQNLGVGGGTLASGTGKHIINESMMNLAEDGDYYIIEGGVNDSSNGVTIGNFTAGYNNTLSPNTFYGAVEKICKQMNVKFKGKKYGFLIPHQMSAPMMPSWDSNKGQFHDAMIKCFEKWGIPYLDLSTCVPPFASFATSGNADLVALNTEYTSNGDGWHPNEAGYKKYYVPKIEAWLKTL